MPDVTFKFNGATVTVREAIGRDVLDAGWLLGDLVDAIAEQQGCKREDLSSFDWIATEWFTGALLRSSVKGKLGFKWPDYKAASREDNLAAYEALMNGPAKLVREWRSAMRDSNLETPDPEE